MNLPWNIGHRGAPGLTGEDNTLRSFDAAIGCGVDLIETDVRCTADGQLICFHDAEAGGDRVEALSLAECRARTTVSIPLFSEFVEFCRGRVGMNVEVKESGYEDLVLEQFATRDTSLPAVIKSFREPTVKMFAEKLIDAPVGYLVDTPEHEPYSADDCDLVIKRAVQLGADFLSPWHGLADEYLIKAARESDLKIICWTVDQEADMRRLIDAGVMGLVSNVPDLLAKVLADYR